MVVRNADYRRLSAQVWNSPLGGNQLGGSGISPNPDHFGPLIEKLAEARDEDFATSIRGRRKFFRACFLKEPARDAFETMLVVNASVPRKFGAGLIGELLKHGVTLPGSPARRAHVRFGSLAEISLIELVRLVPEDARPLATRRTVSSDTSLLFGTPRSPAGSLPGIFPRQIVSI
jgi:hypothetical protein